MFVSLYVHDVSLLYFTVLVKLHLTIQSANTVLLVGSLFLFTYFSVLQSRRPHSVFLYPIE